MKTLKLSWFSSGENKHKYLNLRGPIEDLDQTTIQGVMDFMVGNHAFPNRICNRQSQLLRNHRKRSI